MSEHDAGSRPPANPVHPEQGPSEYAASATGSPSGLTNPERIALGDLAVANTMRALDIDEDAARLLLGGYAEQDRVTISGDRRLVGLFVDETLFAIAERAWLRGLVHPRFN